jgi:hypothetical protein
MKSRLTDTTTVSNYNTHVSWVQNIPFTDGSDPQFSPVIRLTGFQTNGFATHIRA